MGAASGIRNATASRMVREGGRVIASVATAEQLAASITFLLSDDGVNINGVILPSGGGCSVQ